MPGSPVHIIPAGAQGRNVSLINGSVSLQFPNELGLSFRRLEVLDGSLLKTLLCFFSAA